MGFLCSSFTVSDPVATLLADHGELLRLLEEAERLAKERGVFARCRGRQGYDTLRAALDLSVAVWNIEGRRRVVGGSWPPATGRP